MADAGHHNYLLIVVDAVDDAVITYADTVQFRARELAGARRNRVLDQSVDTRSQTLTHASGQAVKLTLRRPLELQPPGHGAGAL